jgi:hypothetical protein
MLMDEIPWMMAPATLIVAILAITLASFTFHNNSWCIKAFVTGATLALTVGVNIF